MTTTNQACDYVELRVTMRSKTTFGVDGADIRVWSGQSATDVAAQTAHGYGADVISIAYPDGTPFTEPEAQKAP